MTITPDDARPNEWHVSALVAVEAAMKSWVRVQANMGAGAYDVFEATGNFPDPVWPEMQMRDVLRAAFRDRLIENSDHPVLQKLAGRA